MTDRTTTPMTWITGGILGLAAWVGGYALTYLIVAPEIRESPLHQFVEAFEGSPATYEMAGWVFFNAHFVQTVFRDVPIVGSVTTSFLGNDGFHPGLHAIPIVILVAIGLGLAYYRYAGSPLEGALATAPIVPGYVLGALAGVVLFTVQIGGARGAPDVVPAILMAGIAYPIVFAIGAGAISGALVQRGRRKPDV